MDEKFLFESNEIKDNNYRISDINIGRPQLNTNINDDFILSTSHRRLSSNIVNNIDTFNSSFHILLYHSQHLSRISQDLSTYLLSSNRFADILPKPKALINPFVPTSIQVPIISVQHRWAHTFPIGKMTIQISIDYKFNDTYTGLDKLPSHFHHRRLVENTKKQELSTRITDCAHFVLPGTTKRLVNKRQNKHSERTQHYSFGQQKW